MKVDRFFNIDASGPSNGGVPEYIAVQYRTLAGEDDIQTFIDGYHWSVAMHMKHVEWKYNSNTLIKTQCPLMISLAIKIHKSQGHKLE